MKTSIKLLILTACVALTGLVSVNALLKPEYDRIDWSNPYQNYVREVVPQLRHVQIMGVPDCQVLIRQDATPFMLVSPNLSRAFWQTSQRGDTLLLNFGVRGFTSIGPVKEPRTGWATNQAEIVLNLPILSSLETNNVQVVLEGFLTNSLKIRTKHTLLHTRQLHIADELTIWAYDGSITQLNADSCGVLRLFVQDVSRVQLGNIQPTNIRPVVEPRAELWLRGQTLGTLTSK